MKTKVKIKYSIPVAKSIPQQDGRYEIEFTCYQLMEVNSLINIFMINFEDLEITVTKVNERG